ncbi:palmitoyltransferase [Sarotherodon galilaeus]
MSSKFPSIRRIPTERSAGGGGPQGRGLMGMVMALCSPGRQMKEFIQRKLTSKGSDKTHGIFEARKGGTVPLTGFIDSDSWLPPAIVLLQL